jgi:hypothetical protein
MKCPKRFKIILGILKIKDKHLFSITNAFYTLDNPWKIDVVKKCQFCGVASAFDTDKETLKEIVNRFPNAFEKPIRDFLPTIL